ncbi:hypothetical protein F4778DRAFT_109981 [Xylariomycetidae sp. FL2044]|nr:hypothetical protein F4778DRAFT_109981 [Xylariomycetidae sp. FL2044]
MCFIEYIGYTCGHTSMATNRPCPMTTQLYTNPICSQPAVRPILAQGFCPSCSRILHGRWIDILEYEHRFMHLRGVCGCKTKFPDLMQPRVVSSVHHPIHGNSNPFAAPPTGPQQRNHAGAVGHRFHGNPHQQQFPHPGMMNPQQQHQGGNNNGKGKGKGKGKSVPFHPKLRGGKGKGKQPGTTDQREHDQASQVQTVVSQGTQQGQHPPNTTQPGSAAAGTSTSAEVTHDHNPAQVPVPTSTSTATGPTGVTAAIPIPTTTSVGTTTSAAAAPSGPSSSAPDSFGPQFTETQHGALTHVALRMRSMYGVEWTQDHAELHAAGRCTCQVSFEKYKPAEQVGWTPERVAAMTTNPMPGPKKNHSHKNSNNSIGSNSSGGEGGEHEEEEEGAAPRVSAPYRIPGYPIGANELSEDDRPRPGQFARWASSPPPENYFQMQKQMSGNNNTNNTIPNPNAGAAKNNSMHHPVVDMQTVQFNQTHGLPLAGFPINAGPEGDSHAGPFEDCDLYYETNPPHRWMAAGYE